MNNQDKNTVDGFGDEWSRFDQSNLPDAEQHLLFDEYFSVFPWNDISMESIGFDLGCGTGRWAKFIAPMTYKLNCIDPSSLALNQARDNLSMYGNCIFECANASENSLQDSSQDFGYSLGVLHHTPDTYEALENCAKKLKNTRLVFGRCYSMHSVNSASLDFRFLCGQSKLLEIILNLYYICIFY